jgi:hypothetical protein
LFFITSFKRLNVLYFFNAQLPCFDAIAKSSTNTKSVNPCSFNLETKQLAINLRKEMEELYYKIVLP